MGKQSATPPAAPDPWQSAQAQAHFNTFNQVTPFGSLTFSGGQSTPAGGMGPMSNPAGFRDSPGGGPGNFGVDGMGGSQYGMPTPRTATLELSPELQNQFDMQNQVTSNTLAQALQRQSDFDATPLNFQGLPEFQSGIDFGALTPIDTNFDAATQRVADALFQRGSAQLDPVFSRQQDRLEQRLADQGHSIGGEAYSRDFGDFRDSMGRAYSDLANQSTLAAGQEQARLFGQSLASRGQGLQEALTALGLNNQARAQGFNERGAVRGAQFNELASLLGLQQTNPSQISMGNFFAPGGADFLGAQGQQTAAQNAAYQGAVNSNNAKTGALGSLGGSGLMALGMMSDRRLKTDIVRVGTTHGGVPLYRYRYKAGGPYHIGVMADELETVNPDAVMTLPDGFKMVDYAMVH